MYCTFHAAKVLVHNICCTFAPDQNTYCGSTLAVASSSTSSRLRRTMARARHTSCRCPTEKLPPPSAMREFSPAGSSNTASFSSTYIQRKSFRCNTTSLYSTYVQKKEEKILKATQPLRSTYIQRKIVDAIQPRFIPPT